MFKNISHNNISLKNISTKHTEKQYISALLTSIEKFIKSVRWKAAFRLGILDMPKDRKENYGFKTLNTPRKLRF